MHVQPTGERPDRHPPTAMK